MSRQVAESPKKYLNSRLGIVNEALKKAYISGMQRIRHSVFLLLLLHMNGCWEISFASTRF